MGDRVVERGVDLVGHDRPLELVGAHPSPSGDISMPSNRAERVAHRCVAAVADVVDQVADRTAQVGVEDVVDAAPHQGVAGVDVHVVPDLAAHHTHPADATGARPVTPGAAGRRRHGRPG